MRQRILLGSILMVVWLLPLAFLPAQNQYDLNLQLKEGVYLRDSSRESADSPGLKFKNLNKTYFYFDKKELKAITAAEKAKDYYLLEELLMAYISKFGVGNFKKDMQLIFKAGKAKEQIGDTTGALVLYELGVNHQRPYDQMSRMRHEVLIKPYLSEWIELEYYFKLLEARRKVDPLVPPKGVMLNMGKKVNSENAEYAPFMHPSDSVLIFTSRRNTEIVIDDMYGKQNEDLYFTEKNFISGRWSWAERFSDEICSEFNEGSACLSRDAKTLIFTRCDSDDGYGSCDLYSANYDGVKWYNVRNIGPHVNSAYWDSHPNLSPNGKVLFFSSNRSGGFGGCDLYYSELLPDSTWGPVSNLGPSINTMAEEVTPFFHTINNTLYFSSTGHLNNYGRYDIYKSRLIGNGWEYPRNLGPLVNTEGNEYYFSINGKGEKLFYAMANVEEEKKAEKQQKLGEKEDELEQNFDLYSFSLPMEARPDAVISLTGWLIDSLTGQPLTGNVLVIDKTEGIEIAPKRINSNGYFEFNLIDQHEYEIYAYGNNYLTVKDNFKITEDSTFTIFAKSYLQGQPIVFQSLEFEENSAEVNESLELKLNYIARFLQNYPMFDLKVIGHTDSDGEAKYNLILSRKRALKIKKYLSSAPKVDGSRISYDGFGESRPLVPNTTDENKKKNRRVEFELRINSDYKGDMILPEINEMDPDEEDLMDDELFNNPFDFDWDDEDDDDYDLEIDLEEDEEFLEEFDDLNFESGDYNSSPDTKSAPDD